MYEFKDNEDEMEFEARRIKRGMAKIKNSWLVNNLRQWTGGVPAIALAHKLEDIKRQFEKDTSFDKKDSERRNVINQSFRNVSNSKGLMYQTSK